MQKKYLPAKPATIGFAAQDLSKLSTELAKFGGAPVNQVRVGSLEARNGIGLLFGMMSGLWTLLFSFTLNLEVTMELDVAIAIDAIV